MKLTFRKHGIPIAIKRRLVMMLSIFILSLGVFITLFNFEKPTFAGEDVTAVSLPTVSVISQNETYGEFFGYKIPMNLGRMRNGLIPLDVKRTVEFNINTYGNKIDGISYEINTGDGKRRLEKEEVANYSKSGSLVEFPLTLTNLTEEGTEYLLTLNLTSRGEEYHYYMRIKYMIDGYEKECMDFAKNFMETALSDKYEDLATYMEPRASARNGLSRVTINSSLNDVGWQGFEVESHTDPRVSFAEIDKNYTALNLRYFVTGKQGVNSGTYIVDEYYRMRNGDERIYLLDFERNISQLFSEEVVKLSENRLILGQNGNDIEFVSNKTGTNVAFVWAGDLYEYNMTTNVLSRVFHFGPQDVKDPRTVHFEHDIKILDVDENGNINYSVYGYMNAGIHEGVCGIGLYHYDMIEDNSIEQAFLVTDSSYQSLKAGFGIDSDDGGIFLSSTGMLYVSLENNLIRGSLAQSQVETIITAEDGTSFALSGEGRYLAYSDSTGNTITVTDLFTERSREIPAPEGKALRVSYFMGEDLVYGIIPQEYFTIDNKANNLYPMEEIVIARVVEGGGEPLKSYKKEGQFVTSISRENQYNLSLTLSVPLGTGFMEVGGDSIQNTSSLKDMGARLVKVSSGKKAFVAVEFSGKTDLSVGNSVTMRDYNDLDMTYYDNGNLDLFYNVDTERSVYYAYRGLKVLKSDFFLSNAVSAAYEGMGYIVDNNGEYIWQYGRGSAKKAINPETLTEKEKIRRLNLYGCDLEQILSYVYRGNPVYVNETGANPLIITGFDKNTITIYQTANGEEIELLIDDTTKNGDFVTKKYSAYIVK